jgi:hypothetical protein
VVAGLFLAVMVGAGVVAISLVAGRGNHDGSLTVPSDAGPVAAEAMLAPRNVLFGDTLMAHVDVAVDRGRVIPGSVRVKSEFAPWSLVGAPVRARRDLGGSTVIRTTYVLRCVISPCVPPRETAPLEFNPARVTYRLLKGQERGSVDARWPVLVVHSRIVRSDFELASSRTSPWKADLVSMPAVSYRVSPGVIRGIALGAGALLAFAGVVLGFLAMPERAPALEPEPELEPAAEPEPSLPPLEHALVLLEADVRANGAADQRRALELVAEEMEARGDVPLTRRARGMAWSEDVPAVEDTRGLAANVRAALADVDKEPEDDALA